MTTLAGTNARTIVGYVITLLEYPRWVIEREVDFTHCHLQGQYDANDPRCSSCGFGDACRWLNARLGGPSADATLDEMLTALRTAVEFLRETTLQQEQHLRDCQCDTCQWLREALGLLREHRHRS